MRVLQTIAILSLATLALAGSSAAATHHNQKPCSVAKGWKLVARDRYAVIVKRRSSYEYCSRRVGRFRAVAGPSPAVVKLAGRYIATGADGCCYQELFLQDTQTGASVHSADFLYDNTDIPPPGRAPFVLSPNGVVAWIAAIGPASPGDKPHVQLWTMSFASPTTPDDGPWPGTDLANLALYNCAAGCPVGTTIVTWTKNGQPEYAEASGSG